MRVPPRWDRGPVPGRRSARRPARRCRRRSDAEQRSGGGQRAGAGFDASLRGERPGEARARPGSARTGRTASPSAERDLEERAGHGQPAERAAVVVAGRGVGVEHLGQPVRAGVGQRGRGCPACASAAPVPSSTTVGIARIEIAAAVTSRAAELLAQVLRSAPDHQPGQEHRDDRPARGSRRARRRRRRARPRRAACSAARPRRRARCKRRAAS